MHMGLKQVMRHIQVGELNAEMVYIGIIKIHLMMHYCILF